MPRTPRVLFVCLGNICRSPTAQGVTEHIAAGLGIAIDCDSAGTAAYHVGEPPDERSRLAASRRGVDISAQRARQVARADFDDFDYVLAMDDSNAAALRELCPPAQRSRIRLFLSFAPDAGRLDVPDPYYGGHDGFEEVLDLAEQAARGLCRHLERERH